jgi:hypothetical protein
MNLLNWTFHRLPVACAMMVLLPCVAAGCGSVQTYSFQSAAAPERLPELAFDEVRKGTYADHRDLLGPVQVELSARQIAEFPVILGAGRCYRAIAVAEDRSSAIRIALLNESFVEQQAEQGKKGVATLQLCPERSENLLLNVEGVGSRLRVVVAVVQQPE